MKKTIFTTLCVFLLLFGVSCEIFNPKEPDNPPVQNNPPAVVNVTSVTVEPSTLALTVGQSQTLTVNVEPTSATDKTVTWSSNGSQATVDNTGLVSAVSPGIVQVFAKSNSDDTIYGICIVTISPAP